MVFSTPARYRALALAVALALPGLAAAQSGPSAQALTSFAARAKAQGLSAADVADPLVTSSYVDASTGLTHTYLQQRVNGIAIFNATGAVHTDATGKAVLATQDFVAGAAKLAPSPTPALTPEQAVVATSVALGLPRPVGLRPVVEARYADGMLFNKAGISQDDIPVQLMYTRVDGKLVLVWNVSIAQLDQLHHWNVRVDAQTGRFVEQNDYTVSEQTTFNQLRLRAQAKQQRALAFQPAAQLSPASTTAANSVTVFALPLEAPNQGGRTVVPLAPVGSAYSPYGWQVAQAPAGTFADTYSLLSSGKYLTRGNNVAAYDDNSNAAGGAGDANYKSATSSPDGGATLNFDFPFDQAAGPRNNLNSATTNLFYINNMMHDVMLAHGFDEPSGNFQYKNATGTGAGLDPVRAESQDGGGRDNANFSTPNDGSTGTMQMYLWDNVPTTLTVTGSGNGAAGVVGTYTASPVSFGPSLAKKPLNGKLVLVNDGVSADGGDHGCATPFVNAAAVSGNIAFIQRGGCPQLHLSTPANNAFAPKVKRAQANGATAVIVFDSLATTNQVSFGGTDTVGIRIPAIFISGADGFKLRAALLSGATLNGSAVTVVGPDWDGSLDNGIVSHEYGHGISNRLTGGPANSSCLIANVGTTAAPVYTQQMGEGWSDFFALWMTTKPGEDGSTSRYVGTYVEGQTPSLGTGIRTKPYSTNLSRNNLTYGAISSTGYQESHNLGEVWTSALWDLDWQFIYKYGYSSDVYSTTGGNNKLLKLVLDGCKLQVCNPGFLDGRDAILRADSITNRAANSDLIWNVFARRGMGYSALPGDRINGTPRFSNVKEAYDIPPKAKVILLSNKSSVVAGSALEAYPNPAQDLLTVRTQLSSAAPVQVAVYDLLGKVVIQSVAVPAAQMQQAGVELNTSRLGTGIYIVRVATTEGTYTTKVTIQH